MKQIVVWPGTVLEENQHQDFRNWVKKELGGEVGTIEQVTTLPTPGEPGTGGRKDIFFTVVEGTNMSAFAVKRMGVGMRWWEDVLGNGDEDIYPESIKEKYVASW